MGPTGCIGLAPIAAATKEREFYRLKPLRSTSTAKKYYFISIACIWLHPGRNRPARYLISGISGMMQFLMQAVENTPVSLIFSDVNQLASDDMRAVDALIRDSLKSDVKLVSQVSDGLHEK